MEELELVIKIVTFLIVFGCLLFIAYVTTRYIAQKTSTAMKSKHMKVIEVISLGMDKNIYLIQVGDKFILVAVSGRNIRYLTDVQFDSNEEFVSHTDQSFDFSSIISKYLTGKHSQQAPSQSMGQENISKSGQGSNHTKKIRKAFETLKGNDKGGDGNIDE